MTLFVLTNQMKMKLENLHDRDIDRKIYRIQRTTGERSYSNDRNFKHHTYFIIVKHCQT